MNRFILLLLLSLLYGCDRENQITIIGETPEVIDPVETIFLPDHVYWNENEFRIEAKMGKATRCINRDGVGGVTETTEYIIETDILDYPDTIYLDEISEAFMVLDAIDPEYSTIDLVLWYNGEMAYAIEDEIQWTIIEERNGLLKGTFSGSFLVETEELEYIPIGNLSGSFEVPLTTMECQ